MSLELNKSHRPTVSVIIPCQNEDKSIQYTLEQTALAEACEIIVVDGGSTDDTLEILKRLPIQHTLLTSELANRAAQMNLGAQQARGEILLFLHADTVLPEFAIREIQTQHLAGKSLGCFRRTFTPRSRLLDFTSALAFWRSKLLFWSFGDQAIFIDSSKFKALGGYREMPRIEDLDLSLRAKRICDFSVIDSPIQTSARRFADAPVKRLLKDLALSLGYITGLYRPK